MKVKRLIALTLMLPMLVTYPVSCQQQTPNTPVTPEPEPEPEPEPDPDIYEKAAPEVKNGDSVLATNPNAEKFLTEVTYPDKDWSYSVVLNYYGGFNQKTYDENGNEDPSGKVVTKPNSDRPSSYSIRWGDKASEEAKTLLLSDNTGWSQTVDIKAGKPYVDITNLIPNATYTYKVSTTGGEVVTEGTFTTTGHLHQIFFQNACRNGRDLGGWKTLDGKTVKYRLLYRGGRMAQGETLTKTGQQEALDANIGAQLDLRGLDDVLTKAQVKGTEFFAPIIEQGGKVMLGVSKPSQKICDRWLGQSESYQPTEEEYAACQKAYAEKTKACFDFTLQNAKAGKGTYFHCSLGRDRTGTLACLFLGLLGVREGDISKEYEITYFAPLGYSVSSSEQDGDYIFKNTRDKWVYSEVAPYFWSMATDGTFASGVENYLLTVAGVPQADIDEFRKIMLQ